MLRVLYCSVQCSPTAVLLYVRMYISAPRCKLTVHSTYVCTVCVSQCMFCVPLCIIRSYSTLFISNYGTIVYSVTFRSMLASWQIRNEQFQTTQIVENNFVSSKISQLDYHVLECMEYCWIRRECIGIFSVECMSRKAVCSEMFFSRGTVW